MCTWTGCLPWHYLAGPVCMLNNSKKYGLEDDFPESEQDCEVPADGADPKFIEAVKRQATERKKSSDAGPGAKKFDWDDPWPSGLQVCLRDLGNDRRSNFVLTPGTIYFHRNGAPAIDANKANSGAALNSDCFMRAIDFLVACPMGRTIFLNGRDGDDPPTDGAALARIKEVMGRDKACDHAGIPVGMKVDVRTDIKTTETHFECKDGQLTLHLGWRPDPVNGDKSCRDADKFTGFDDYIKDLLKKLGWDEFDAVTARLMMVEWPCGATE